jgi:hypothetical protein
MHSPSPAALAQYDVIESYNAAGVFSSHGFGAAALSLCVIIWPPPKDEPTINDMSLDAAAQDTCTVG